MDLGLHTMMNLSKSPTLLLVPLGAGTLRAPIAKTLALDLEEKVDHYCLGGFNDAESTCDS